MLARASQANQSASPSSQLVLPNKMQNAPSASPAIVASNEHYRTYRNSMHACCARSRLYRRIARRARRATPRRRLAFGISSGHKLSGISFFLAKAPHRRSHEVSGCFCLSVGVFLKRLRTVTATLDPRLGARRPFATPAAPTRPPAVPARQLSEESKHETSNPLTGEAYRPPHRPHRRGLPPPGARVPTASGPTAPRPGRAGAQQGQGKAGRPPPLGARYLFGSNAGHDQQDH